MADLTDKQNDLIIICPDAKTMTAYEAWYDKLTVDEKVNFKVDDGKYIISSTDPLGTLDATRDELIKLVDDNAESMTDIVRIKFSGTTFETLAFIVSKVAKPPEELEDTK